MINDIRDFFERWGFEVCTRLGDKMGIRPSVVRLYFIYVSFVALGSPVLLYIILAFWIRLKDYVQGSRTSVLDI
jgi:phage shock protein PspC (stress-responsive transcriptional regulator)